MKNAILKFAYSLLGKSPAKTRLIKKYSDELAVFLAGQEKIIFPPIYNPKISVLIPVWNSAYHTLRCLKSLAADQSCSIEVIVFNNSSTDQTKELLERCENIVVINNLVNVGFVGATNGAAAVATGKLVLMMNNDITIASGTLNDAAKLFDTEPVVGAVGALLKLATGRVQEAGAIIYRNGATNGFLRHRKHALPEGMFVRDVDYCSGAFLLLERQHFLDIGGLDEMFAPGYYEETDLCMRIRSLGKRVIYTPELVLSHFEFGSFASGAAFERMERNRKIFVDRWKREIDEGKFSTRLSSSFVASRRLVRKPRVLLILESLENAVARETASELVQQGWQVSLMVKGLKVVDWPAFHKAHSAKVEFIPDQGLRRLKKARAKYFNAILSCDQNLKAQLQSTVTDEPISVVLATALESARKILEL
jgi:GT2 family glycosyltransferase